MSFSALFYPKSVAVIGASRKEKTVGNDIFKNLITQGFEGQVYPVNPKADTLYDQHVYHTVEEIPGTIDLAIIAIPAPTVTQAVKAAQQKGAQAAIVISAGFKEAGNLDLENELKQFCQTHHISLVGPNCLGVINPEISLNASFATILPKPGNIAFVSQSGALCTAVLDYAQKLDIGFSKFMSIGNKADIDELKLIKYFADDPQTQVLAFYVEELENAPALITAIQNITQSENAKPVIILKAGRTQAGAQASLSHTGSLSGGEAAYQALFKQAGVIQAKSISQLFDFAQIFSHHQIKTVKNTAIITNAGGPGVLTTDEVVSNGLKLAKLSETTQAKLRQILPAAANTHNPIDLLGDARADRYQHTLHTVITAPEVDSAIVILTPQSMTEITATAQAIVDTQAQTKKPILACFMGQKTVNPGVKILQKNDIVVTTFPEPAAKALAAYSHFVKWNQQEHHLAATFSDVNQTKVQEIFNQAKANGQTRFGETQALEILTAYGFPVLKTMTATSAQQASHLIEANDKNGETESKWAMKIISSDILHKSDVGGVALNVTAQTAAAEYETMIKRVTAAKPEATLAGVLLMEMAPKNGIEVILGVNKAPRLGTMIMFGLGGIYVEVFKDVSFAFAPLNENDALDMIESLQSAALFDGVRGQKGVDKQLLAKCIEQISQLVTDFPEIVELDINPLLALPGEQGVKMLDARLIIK